MQFLEKSLGHLIQSPERQEQSLFWGMATRKTYLPKLLAITFLHSIFQFREEELYLVSYTWALLKISMFRGQGQKHSQGSEVAIVPLEPSRQR